MAAATREGASTMEGTKMTTGDANTSRTESPGPAKMVGAKKKKYRSKKITTKSMQSLEGENIPWCEFRSRSASASSQDSFSSGSYTGSSSDEDEVTFNSEFEVWIVNCDKFLSRLPQEKTRHRRTAREALTSACARSLRMCMAAGRLRLQSRKCPASWPLGLYSSGIKLCWMINFGMLTSQFEENCQAQGEGRPATEAGEDSGMHSHQRSDCSSCRDASLPWRSGNWS